MTWPKSKEQCAIEEAERHMITGRGHPIQEKLVALIDTYLPKKCMYCCRALDRGDHTFCRAISDLAAFRGTSFEEAERQFQDDELIDRTTAQMLGAEVDDELVGPAGSFDIEE